MAERNTVEAPEMRAFGVGCFHFAWRKPLPFVARADDYANDLRAALGRIDTISAIEVTCLQEDDGYEVSEGPFPRLEEGTGWFPSFDYLETVFDIQISERVQREILPRYLRGRTGGESLRVYLTYSYFGPLSFVEVLDASTDSEPSTAVVLLRKYLRAQSIWDDSPISFECLGPSPFHVDFFLASATSEECGGSEFARERRGKQGYDRVTFRYARELHRDSASAFGALRSELEDELGLYYAIVGSNLRGHLEWERIETDLVRIGRLPESRSPLRRIRLAIDRGAVIQEVKASLASFEAHQIVRGTWIEQQHRTVYSDPRDRFLADFVEYELEQKPVFPTEPVARLIAHAETRRSRLVEIVVILLAAVLGGIAGSAVTLFVN